MLASAPLGLDDFCMARLGEWWLYFGADAPIQMGRQVCLVGLAADIDTAEPVRIVDIKRRYALSGLDAVVDYTDQIVGRFLVLVEDGGKLSVIPDGWGSLQSFWGQSSDGLVALSSSPGLMQDLGLGSESHRDTSRPNGRLAKALEFRSVGDHCPVSGTRRIRPNHISELSSGSEERLPLRPREATFETVTAELGRAIRGLQAAHGGESWMPVTAGIDSRWLTWAASLSEADVRLFTFTPGAEPTPDSSIGAKIADRLDAQHTQIALPARVSASVRDDVTAVRGAWRARGRWRYPPAGRSCAAATRPDAQ